MYFSFCLQWDLVCEKQQYAELTQSAFMAGNFLGCLVCGYLGDRFGCRNTGIVCNLILVLGQMLGSNAQTYEQFAAIM